MKRKWKNRESRKGNGNRKKQLKGMKICKKQQQRKILLKRKERQTKQERQEREREDMKKLKKG